MVFVYLNARSFYLESKRGNRERGKGEGKWEGRQDRDRRGTEWRKDTQMKSWIMSHRKLGTLPLLSP